MLVRLPCRRTARILALAAFTAASPCVMAQTVPGGQNWTKKPASVRLSRRMAHGNDLQCGTADDWDGQSDGILPDAPVEPDLRGTDQTCGTPDDIPGYATGVSLPGGIRGTFGQIRTVVDYTIVQTFQQSGTDCIVTSTIHNSLDPASLGKGSPAKIKSATCTSLLAQRLPFLCDLLANPNRFPVTPLSSISAVDVVANASASRFVRMPNGVGLDFGAKTPVKDTVLAPALSTDTGFFVYGGGTPGTSGCAPWLDGTGPGTVGSANNSLDAGQGLEGSLAVLASGFGQAVIPVQGGELLIAQPLVFLPLVLSGTQGAPCKGTASIPFSVPNNPLLVGALMEFQLLVLDPGAVRGVAMSNGLELEIG